MAAHSRYYQHFAFLNLSVLTDPPQNFLGERSAISQSVQVDIQAVSVFCESKQQCSQYQPTYSLARGQMQLWDLAPELLGQRV